MPDIDEIIEILQRRANEASDRISHLMYEEDLQSVSSCHSSL